MDAILRGTQAAPLTVVLTLRGDFFGQALSYRPLADRLQGAVVILGPMNREELALAVAEPARVVGLSFESGLVERLLDDVGQEPGNPPLLEFALTSLWEHRQGGQLLHRVYDRMGRVQGAVAQHAEELYQRLTPEEQQSAARVFLELVQTGEGTGDTRRRASFQDVGIEPPGARESAAPCASHAPACCGRGPSSPHPCRPLARGEGGLSGQSLAAAEAVSMGSKR